MNSTSRNILIGIVIVVLIALLGFFAWQEKQASENAATATTTPVTTSTSTTALNLNESATTSVTENGYTITPIRSGSTAQAPNYKTPLSFSASISADEQAQDQAQFAAAQTALASDPKNFEAWLTIAQLREATGDYTGAAADWKYVTEIYPSDPTAFADLGDLYANYLHEPAQGIAEYKAAIKIDPTKEETFYDNLAQIYLNEGDETDAKSVLQQGINAQVIGYQNLQTELNSMQ